MGASGRGRSLLPERIGRPIESCRRSPSCGYYCLPSGLPDASLELIGQAIKLNKQNPLYFFDIRNTLLQLTRFDEALDCYDKALALEPRNVAAFNNQGTRVCSPSSSTKRSPVVTGRSPLEPGDAFPFNNRGNVLAEPKRFDEALACRDKAPALMPGDAAAFSSRGNACVKRGANEWQQDLTNFSR
jgi:tetratricopeptide (TPR) repeat protein